MSPALLCLNESVCLSRCLAAGLPIGELFTHRLSVGFSRISQRGLPVAVVVAHVFGLRPRVPRPPVGPGPRGQREVRVSDCSLCCCVWLFQLGRLVTARLWLAACSTAIHALLRGCLPVVVGAAASPLRFADRRTVVAAVCVVCRWFRWTAGSSARCPAPRRSLTGAAHSFPVSVSESAVCGPPLVALFGCSRDFGFVRTPCVCSMDVLPWCVQLRFVGVRPVATHRPDAAAYVPGSCSHYACTLWFLA